MTLKPSSSIRDPETRSFTTTARRATLAASPRVSSVGTPLQARSRTRLRPCECERVASQGLRLVRLLAYSGVPPEEPLGAAARVARRAGVGRPPKPLLGTAILIAALFALPGGYVAWRAAGGSESPLALLGSRQTLDPL